MKPVAWALGVLSIAVIGLGPFAYIAGAISLDAYKWLALALTVVWFVAALWPGAEESLEHAIDE